MNGTQTLEHAHSEPINIGVCYRQPDFEFWNADSLIKMKELPDNSVNCILTDPPYKYLKNQKLEVDFDETIFFKQAKRVLTNDGFIVLFGRGTSFYRWNTTLSDLGFSFKEDIVWDKRYNSSPVTPINRFHESISIHAKNNSSINISYVEYTESKPDIYSVINDIKRIKSALNNMIDFKQILDFLETGSIEFENNLRTLGNNTTVQTSMSQQKQSVKTVQAITKGMKERSIMSVKREHFGSIHPTQKPVRLLERLLALTTKEGDLVLDAFAGSCSTGHACLNSKRKFIGYEIDREYFDKAVKRIKTVEPPLFSGCL